MQIKRRDGLTGRTFHKSSFSPEHGFPHCVAVSIAEDDVLIRRSDDEKPVLNFSREEWKAFVLGVKNSEFDVR